MDGDSIFMVASGYFPPFSKLNTSVNCTATTDYFADNVILMAEGHYLTNYKLGDSGIITNWLHSTILDDWTGLRNVSDMTGMLMVWFEGVWQNDTYLESLEQAERAVYVVMIHTTHDAAYTCDDRKICDKLDVRGDPDVSGIGMMLAYYILTGLTVVYFPILTFRQMNNLKDKQSHLTNWRQAYKQRLIAALQQTAGGFLNAALVFATAMLGATVARYYTFQKHQDGIDVDDVSFYTWLGSAFMSTFSIFPCLMLQTVADLSRSRYSRLFLWCIIACLAATLWALSLPSIDYFLALVRAYGHYEDADTTAEVTQSDRDLLFRNNTIYHTGIYRALVWERYCDSGDLKYRLRTLLRVGFATQIPGVIYCLCSSLIAIFSNSAAPIITPMRGCCGAVLNKVKRIGRVFRPLIGFLYLVMALAFLESFIEYRRIVKGLAPSTDADTDWSFGQILALAQWAPVVLEFMSAWRQERE
ncbi:hypothetical protein BJ166DRAFT_542803 [Pestalotiopsis sp. NC0098]|nr:hypothetical protein BJ166DRAFT_542803 [Pestalotiopsis sp. NC0098]